jgi:hypothetical protein
MVVRWILVLTISLSLLGFGAASASAEQAEYPPGITGHLSEDGSLRFHYPPRFRPMIEQIDRDGTVLFHDLERILGIEDFPTVDVWVLPNLDLFFEYHGLEHRPPRWAVGLSLSKQRTVLVQHGTSAGGEVVDVPRTFAHELAHVAMDEAAGAYRVPRWLNEGFAVMHADEWSPERSDMLSRAAASGTLIAFDRLDRNFPPHHQSASLAYAQSFHFVRHLDRTFGEGFFASLLAGVRQGMPFEVAFEAAAGQPLSEVEADWRADLTTGSSLWVIFYDETVILFGASILFLVAYITRRIRKRRREASMRDEDDLQGWDYDPSRYPLPGQQSES